MENLILGLISLISATIFPVANSIMLSPVPEVQILAHQSLDLTKRAPSSYVNEIFSDNILLPSIIFPATKILNWLRAQARKILTGKKCGSLGNFPWFFCRARFLPSTKI